MAEFVAVLFSGLFAGFLVAVLVLEVAMRNTGPSVYTQFRLIELGPFATLAIVLAVPAVVAIVVLTPAAVRHRSRRDWLVLVAALLLLVTVVITVSINVPINIAQMSWAVGSPPDNWADVRDRWLLAHAARTVTAVAAFALLVWAAARRSSIEERGVGDV